MRRGWVTPMSPRPPRPRSRAILGSCVVLPDPVAPATMTTGCAEMAATMSSTRAEMGSSGGKRRVAAEGASGDGSDMGGAMRSTDAGRVAQGPSRWVPRASGDRGGAARRVRPEPDRVRLLCCCVARHVLRGRGGGPHPPTPSPAGDPAGEGESETRGMGASQEARDGSGMCSPSPAGSPAGEKRVERDEGRHRDRAREVARDTTDKGAAPDRISEVFRPRRCRALGAVDACGRPFRAWAAAPAREASSP